MTIYTPQPFQVHDRPAADALIAAYPFATLITAVDGAPTRVTHLPLLLEGEALVGHMARANPHWPSFEHGRTTAVFHGPHAFVSPRWYERPQFNVPTWNYATVHVGGTPALLDATESRASLQRLMQRFDPEFDTDAGVVDRLLDGIVAFRMRIDAFEAKFKMSQNKSPGDRAGIIVGLLETGTAESLSAAHWMQTHE